jgi:hypothetical protein
MHLFGRLASINGRAWGEWHSKRSVQATWIGGSPDCACQNTLEGIALAANRLEVQRGDKVVSLEGEFPAKNLSLEEAVASGVELTWFQSGTPRRPQELFDRLDNCAGVSKIDGLLVSCRKPEAKRSNPIRRFADHYACINLQGLDEFLTLSKYPTRYLPIMNVKKVSTGQMWRNEQTGDVFVVTSLYKDVLASFATLRNPAANEGNRRAKITKTENGECLVGFTLADLV